jgi:hypothetical protein
MCKSLYGEEKKCVNWVPSSISYIEYTKLNKQENKLSYFMLKYSTKYPRETILAKANSKQQSAAAINKHTPQFKD